MTPKQDDTDKISRGGYCSRHYEHDTRIERNENDIKEIWMSINTMRGFVIAGATSTILTLVAVIAQIAFKLTN